MTTIPDAEIERIKKIGFSAQLPPKYQWGEHAMEAFNFGKKQATEALLAHLRSVTAERDALREEVASLANALDGSDHCRKAAEQALAAHRAAHTPDVGEDAL